MTTTSSATPRTASARSSPPLDYGVIYRIQETTVEVQTLAIGHRSKIYAFRERLAQAE